MDKNDLVLTKCEDALQRLLDNCPEVVPQGTKISNAAVAIEAGYKKGTIRAARPKFAKLIEAILLAAARQATATINIGEKPLEDKELAATHQRSYEKGLARELSLLNEIANLKEQQMKMLAAKVTKIQ